MVWRMVVMLSDEAAVAGEFVVVAGGRVVVGRAAEDMAGSGSEETAEEDSDMALNTKLSELLGLRR
jgi:hypothetical protein